MKYKTGYTTGVFDLFDIGHLNLLKGARDRCEELIVGVTTDELAEERKGKRPIISFEERIEIVRHIRFVDEAVAQSTMNKISAWREFGFDAMFVGDDWRGTPTWNRLEEDFAQLGVDIVYF